MLLSKPNCLSAVKMFDEMVPLRTENLVSIVPDAAYLSSTELIVQRHLEVPSLNTGLKRTHVEGTAEEESELNASYDFLEAKLSIPRIERLSGRALGAWDEQQQAVEVLRKDGKFEHFGYSENGKDYLEFYEALFLLELGRLQLEYHGMVTSIEQAYLLLLGETANIKFNEYLIYSNLTRVGYIVTKYRNMKCEKSKGITSDDCIWAVLKQSLGQHPVPEYMKRTTLFATINASMEANVKHIRQSLDAQQQTQSSEPSLEAEFIFCCSKRKSNETTVAIDAATSNANKKSRIHSATSDEHQATVDCSLIDFLKVSPEYEKFRHIFQKFDVIQLKSNDMCAIDCKRNLKISFELYMHNEGHSKRTPKTPTFRAIIVDSGQHFPTHDELVKCQREQLHCGGNVPLLVITVSESKQIQAFVYYIS